jgi:hypothetical protein
MVDSKLLLEKCEKSFLNQEKTDVIYWALINWSKLRDKFNN